MLHMFFVIFSRGLKQMEADFPRAPAFHFFPGSLQAARKTLSGSGPEGAAGAAGGDGGVSLGLPKNGWLVVCFCRVGLGPPARCSSLPTFLRLGFPY